MREQRAGERERGRDLGGRERESETKKKGKGEEELWRCAQADAVRASRNLGNKQYFALPIKS